MKDAKKCWRKKARIYLAAAFGGKCTICSYDKTIAALDYHHINSKEKNHALSTAMRNGYAWHKIVEEARKCTIVCCRCHREIHAGVTSLPRACVRFNEEYVDIIKLKTKEFDKCPICDGEKYKNLNYCSTNCYSISQRKFEITKEELEHLVNLLPYEKIGKMYGVSGNAIKKRCKTLKINLGNRRGFWAKQRVKYVTIEEKKVKS